MDLKQDLLAQVELNKEYRLKVLRLSNEILEVKLNYLTALKKHYKDYWLDLDLKSYDSKIDCLINRAKLMVCQTRKDKIDEVSQKLEQESILLDEEITQVKDRLDQFNRLDPNLLAEYRMIKDDLECQEMLIEISENNKTYKA